MLNAFLVQWCQVEHIVVNMALAGTRLQIGVKEIAGVTVTIPLS